MRREARILKLESCLDLIENEDDLLLRAAGKTRRQAIADHRLWLQKRLARRQWPDEERVNMQTQIDKLTEILARLPETEQ